ncbi:MAG: beta-galactosidase [Microbacteriaceae bacterium]|nr:MAG: beta-galactosidase [Microbacteriaceae bacterium]
MDIASRQTAESSGEIEVVAPWVPRAEYPRPQFARADWLCLNGEWEFEVDRKGLREPAHFESRRLDSAIMVPFAPESALSGVGIQGFLEVVWYRRSVDIPIAWAGRRVLLHFQACDHDTTVWVNGRQVGRHRGGFTPFEFDVTDAIDDDGPVIILVRAKDGKGIPQARGKQSDQFENYEAYYTRTTGIWQTVWLEPVEATRLSRPRITPNLQQGEFRVEVPLIGSTEGVELDVVLSDGGDEIVRRTIETGSGSVVDVTLPIPTHRRRSWSPSDPHLYDIDFVVRANGRVLDRASSYAGLRSVGIDGKRMLLNGETLFQRLVLDQGWYPDGLMTAPTEADLVRDIELAQEAGFNGARLHQKVFEERFLYHADRLGYLVWGEFADWGARVSGEQAPTPTFITQWVEVLERDYSHPSLVGWCPLNETFEAMADEITVLDDVTRGMYLVTKAIDEHRPVIDASGYSHRVDGADVYDSHNYEQDPIKFAQQMGGLADGNPYVNTAPDGTAWSVPYRGQPYFCSEFGGIWWSTTDGPSTDSWGYGDAPRTIEEWYNRAEALFSVLISDPEMFGYCFTQLTDVFQEKNGIFTFDRQPKFDLARIRAIQNRPAAIELGSPVVHPARRSLASRQKTAADNTEPVVSAAQRTKE